MRSQKQAKDFVERSTFRGCLALCRDWFFIVFIAWLSLWVDQWWMTLLSIWVIGYLQFCLGEALLHEASHYNLFASKKLHYLLQGVYAYPFFQTLKGFQHEHLLHHSNLMGAKDVTMHDYHRYGLMETKPNMFYIWFLKPFLGGPTWYYLKSGPDFDSWSSRLQLAAFWVPVLALFIATGTWELLVVYWMIPLVWSFPIFQYWSEIEEHYNTLSGARSNVSFWDNFFKHNEGYHWIHHRYPTIPFYRLPEAHAFLTPSGTDISQGFFDSYRQMSRPQAPAWPGHPALRPGPLKDPASTLRSLPSLGAEKAEMAQS